MTTKQIPPPTVSCILLDETERQLRQNGFINISDLPAYFTEDDDITYSIPKSQYFSGKKFCCSNPQDEKTWLIVFCLSGRVWIGYGCEVNSLSKLFDIANISPTKEITHSRGKLDSDELSLEGTPFAYSFSFSADHLSMRKDNPFCEINITTPPRYDFDVVFDVIFNELNRRHAEFSRLLLRTQHKLKSLPNEDFDKKFGHFGYMYLHSPILHYSLVLTCSRILCKFPFNMSTAEFLELVCESHPEHYSTDN